MTGMMIVLLLLTTYCTVLLETVKAVCRVDFVWATWVHIVTRIDDTVEVVAYHDIQSVYYVHWQ